MNAGGNDDIALLPTPNLVLTWDMLLCCYAATMPLTPSLIASYIVTGLH